MRLFKLDISLDNKVIGAYPQVEEMIKGYDYDAKDSVYQLVYNRNKYIDFTPNLESFLLKKKAKFTDLIGAIPIGGASGLLISGWFKEILTSFNLMTHQFFAAVIVNHVGHANLYYWMHLVSNLSLKVNYEFSKFYKSGGDKVKITSFENFLIKKKRLGVFYKITSKEIAIQEKDIEVLDLFYFGNFDFGIYISERLKNKLEEKGITGINLTEIKTTTKTKNDEKIIILNVKT